MALDPPDSLCRSTQELLTTLIIKHLVRLLRVASHIFVLDAASFAIQVTDAASKQLGAERCFICHPGNRCCL